MNELAGLLLEASWRIVPPALVAALTVIVLRRSSPRTAHTIWAAMLTGMLVLPLLVAVGPRWPVAVPALRLTEPVLTVLLTVPSENLSSAPSHGEPIRALQPPVAEPGRGLPRLGWGAIYGFGLTVLLGRFLYGLWSARRVRRACREIAHPRLEALARELLPGRTVIFCSSSAVQVPFTTGLLRPRVFLPPDWDTWKDDSLRGAVGHELCHVRRRDYAWAFLAELNLCLYWFHPLAWYLPRRLSLLADRISDELAASAVPSAAGYARLLVEMAERVTTGSGRLVRAAAPTLPMVGTGGLAERVDALLSQPRRGRRSPPRWTGATAGLALTGVLLLSAVVEVGAGSGSRSAIGKSPDEFIAALASADPETRAAAAFGIARRPGEEEAAIPHLLPLLGDDERIAAPLSWSVLRDGWMPARRVWQHPAPGEVATIGLASFGSRSALPLLSALASADPVVRRNAAWGLGEIRQPRGIPEEGLASLVRALRDPDAGVRAAAAWAAGDIRIQDAVPELVRILRQDPSSRARAEAAKALGEIRNPAAVDDLKVARGSELHPTVRWAIRGALAELR